MDKDEMTYCCSSLVVGIFPERYSAFRGAGCCLCAEAEAGAAGLGSEVLQQQDDGGTA